MARFELPTDLGPPFPFRFPDTGLVVSFRDQYWSFGTVSKDGMFSCDIENSEIIDLLESGKAEWYFDSVDGRLFVQILES